MDDKAPKLSFKYKNVGSLAMALSSFSSTCLPIPITYRYAPTFCNFAASLIVFLVSSDCPSVIMIAICATPSLETSFEKPRTRRYSSALPVAVPPLRCFIFSILRFSSARSYWLLIAMTGCIPLLYTTTPTRVADGPRLKVSVVFATNWSIFSKSATQILLDASTTK